MALQDVAALRSRSVTNSARVIFFFMTAARCAGSMYPEGFSLPVQRLV
jgi:hypothetical protein